MISVIIPNFNRYHTLLRALNSVLAQTVKIEKVFIIDDNSNLEIFNAIADCIAEQSDVEIHRNMHGKGASAARNYGLTLCQTKYVAFLDSDDWWDPCHLEWIFDHITASNSESGIFYSGSRYIDEYGHCIREINPGFNAKNLFSRLIEKQVLPNISCFVLPTVVARSMGGFDELMLRGNDGDFLRRLSVSNLFYTASRITCNVAVGSSDRISFNSVENLRNELNSLRRRKEKFRSYSEFTEEIERYLDLRILINMLKLKDIKRVRFLRYLISFGGYRIYWVALFRSFGG